MTVTTGIEILFLRNIFGVLGNWEAFFELYDLG